MERIDGNMAEIQNFIQKVCRLYGRGMEPEDCLQEGWCGYLEARSSYSRVEGCCGYWEYVLACIHGRIVQAKRDWFRSIPWGTISTDRAVRGGEAPVGSFLLREAGEDFVDRFAFADYVEHFDEDARRAAWLYIGGCSEEEIMEHIHCTAVGLEKVRCRLRVYLLDYLEC